MNKRREFTQRELINKMDSMTELFNQTEEDEFDTGIRWCTYYGMFYPNGGAYAHAAVQIPHTQTILQPVLECGFRQEKSWANWITDAMGEDKPHFQQLVGDQCTFQQFEPAFQQWCSNSGWHSLCPNELIWAILETDASTKREELLGTVMLQPSEEGWNLSFFIKKSATRKRHATNAAIAAVKWLKDHVGIFKHSVRADGKEAAVPSVILLDHDESNLASAGTVRNVLEECGGKRVADSTTSTGKIQCNYLVDLLATDLATAADAADLPSTDGEEEIVSRTMDWGYCHAVALKEDQKKAIRTQIEGKLLQLIGVDVLELLGVALLSQYVMVMLEKGRSMRSMQEQLTEVTGEPESTQFWEWFHDRLREVEPKCEERMAGEVPKGDREVERVRLLHISDTHSMHGQIEEQHPMPEADVLIHTGDFTDCGSAREIEDFNRWLGEIKEQKGYKHIIVIFGNHEWERPMKFSCSTREYAKQMLPNATVLEHEEVEACGIRIYGSAWCPLHRAGCQDGVAHRFDEIPDDVDILLTHGAAHGIFDRLEGGWGHWGSSETLRTHIERAKPKVHLFGHIHEQRGTWSRDSLEEAFQGGVEYQPAPGEEWETFPPPPKSYPCQLISCNAMKNHPGLEGRQSHIAGRARLILAEREMMHADEQAAAGGWRFSLPSPSPSCGVASPA
jgi:Icc-related predicted phosphoesterase